MHVKSKAVRTCDYVIINSTKKELSDIAYRPRRTLVTTARRVIRLRLEAKAKEKALANVSNKQSIAADKE
jgi:hypothetical protein